MKKHNSPEETVISFIKAMNDWEIYCNTIENMNGDDDEIEKSQRERLEHIFSKYCTHKVRKTGRIENISYGDIGSFDYDPVNESIHSSHMHEEKAIVETNKARPIKEKFQYIIHKKDDRWLIDSKKTYDSKTNKWNSIAI